VGNVWIILQGPGGGEVDQESEAGSFILVGIEISFIEGDGKI
jgi:hypothetical protein